VRFASLGSGSKGNATLISNNTTCLLVDNGFSIKETERRLARLGLEADRLTAILVTHEHGDHIRGVGPLARKYGIPVWTTRGTASHVGLGELPMLHNIDVHQPLELGDIEVQPFPVPHDAREPCQFVFGDGAKRLGILTDTGSTTTHIVEQLSGCDALMLECNHDTAMLMNGSYPESLKARVGGRFGHLSNEQAAELLVQLDTQRLQHLVAAHLSEQNNTSDLACWALSTVLNCEPDWITVAQQDSGLSWREI
jgi:phosphoribosyl 1,2-cyclic phosphodiesterase